MRERLRPTMLLLAAFCAAPASAQPGDAEAVLTAVRALDARIVAKDAEGLAELLLPDFVGAIPTGATFTKDEYIAFHCRPDEGLAAIQPAAASVPAVRVFDGRFAVVNRRLVVRRQLPDGAAEAYEVQRIEALVKRDGHWRVASGQGTRAQPPPPAR